MARFADAGRVGSSSAIKCCFRRVSSPLEMPFDMKDRLAIALQERSTRYEGDPKTARHASLQRECGLYDH